MFLFLLPVPLVCGDNIFAIFCILSIDALIRNIENKLMFC